MSPILLYLLKANAALLLFAAAYFGLLRRLTFFTLNRFYLLFALLFSAAYPVLPMPALFPAEAALPGAFVLTEAPVAMSTAVAASPVALALDWEAVGLVLYAGGAAVLLGRLLVQLLSLWQLRRSSRPSTAHGQPIRALAGAVSPFSFWQTIYLNPLQHPDAELAAVLRHEQVHVRQWHTLDVLLAQVAHALAWANPAAWLLRRALLDNLEYLADHAALQTGLDRRAYQYSLLRLSQGATGPALVSHFTFLTLKNRVAMMNTPLSSTGQLTRYFVAGPLVLAAALGFSAAQAQGAGPVVPVPIVDSASRPASIGGGETAYYVDGHRTDMKAVSMETFQSVATMKLLKGAQVRQVFGEAEPASRVTIIVTSRHRDRADVLALDHKVDAAGALDTHFKMGPSVDPAKHQLPTGIKSYIAKTYPAAKLSGWGISEQASAKAPYVKYFANVTEGEVKRMLYFNAEELPVMPVAQAASQSSPTAPAAAQLATAATANDAPAAAVAEPQQSSPPVYYVDGQLYAGDINAIKPKDILSMHVLKGDRARQAFGEAGAAGVVIVTTKQNQNQPAVVAFNEKLGLGASAYIAPPANAPANTPRVAYLAPEALAYITKTYPGARLLGVSEVPGVDGGATRYQAEIVLGRRPGYLLFDAQGKFISDSYTSNAR